MNIRYRLLAATLLTLYLGVVGAPCASAATTSPTADLSRSGSTPTLGTDAPTSSQSQSPTQTQGAASTAATVEAIPSANAWVASLALIGAVGLGGGILLLVNQAHSTQREIALRSLRQGRPVQIQVPSAGGLETARADRLMITGPDELAVNTVGEYSVPVGQPNLDWSVQGIKVFGGTPKDDHTYLFTPHEISDAVTVHVQSENGQADKQVKILPAPRADGASGSGTAEAAAVPVVVRLVVRNWGLVLVAVAIVFGAVALAVVGRLDGGNFVALVAPLAALLGVTAVSGGGGSGGSGGSGSSAGSGTGAT